MIIFRFVAFRTVQTCLLSFFISNFISSFSQRDHRIFSQRHIKIWETFLLYSYYDNVSLHFELLSCVYKHFWFTKCISSFSYIGHHIYPTEWHEKKWKHSFLDTLYIYLSKNACFQKLTRNAHGTPIRVGTKMDLCSKSPDF